MEKRLITEIKIYKLLLNLMRDRLENQTLLAVATDKQKLIDWYNSQFATEPYTDSTSEPGRNYRKAFKPESKLNWFNPCIDINTCDPWGHGIAEEWVEETFFINSAYISELIIDRY